MASEEKQAPIHVWSVKQAVDGSWTLTSGQNYAITGFADETAAHEWVAQYLIEFTRMTLQHQAMMANLKADQEHARMMSVAPLMEPDPGSKPN